MSRLELFGGAVVTTTAGPITGRAAQRHRVGLLALLSTTRRLYRNRDQLVGLLWPDADAERGRKLLSDSIYRINQALGDEAVTGAGDDVRLNRLQVASDVADFEAALEAREWRRAVELSAGPFLDGFFIPGAAQFDQWMETERAHYAREVAKAMEAVAVDARDGGRLAEAADWWQRLAALVPDDSRIAMELMRALELAGNRAGALRHARIHSLVLRETLGVEPDRSIEELADRIARRSSTLAVATGPERAPLDISFAADEPPEPDVHELYLRARLQWQRRTEECLKDSAALFEQVVEREPDHPRGWIGLADAYLVLGFHDLLPPRVAFPRAECAARQAMRLDPTMAAPCATLACVDTHYYWHWASAERGFRRAIDLEPTNATAHEWYGNLLAILGRFGEAERQTRRAADLDPLSMGAHTAVGWVLHLAGDAERAIRHLRGMVQLEPGFALAHYHLGVALDQGGRSADAIPVLQHALEQSNGCGIVSAALARAYAMVGNTESARTMLDGLLQREARGRYISSYGLGKIYHALGDVPAAVTRFERAYRDRAHSIPLLKVDPQLRSLAADARFAELIERVDQASTSSFMSVLERRPDIRSVAETAFSPATGARERGRGGNWFEGSEVGTS
jgi:DNA-binding SARP family transcriptional activator/Tfp pilus assembly protein PilF